MSKMLFYIPVSLSGFLVFRFTWLPGARLFHGKEDVVILLCFLIMFSFYFDFRNLFSLNVNVFYNNRYLLLFIGVLTVYSTIFYNYQELTNIKGLLRFFSYFAMFCMYFLMFPNFLIQNAEYYRKFVMLICLFGFFSAFLGVFMLFSGIYPIPLYNTQLISIISHPNVTSMIFTISTITTLYYYFWKKEDLSSFGKIFIIISIILQTMAQLLTLTRAGIIGMFLGLIIFLIMYYRRKAIFILPILMALAPVFLIGFFTAKGFDSFVSRFMLLVPAYFMIIENSHTILWGYGFTNSLDVYQTYKIAYNVLEANIEDPHNSIVMLILMVGLPITLLIMFFTAKYITKGLKTGFRSKNYDRRLFASYSSCLLISIIVHCIFDSELVRIEHFTMTIFLSFLGLLYVVPNKSLVSNNKIFDKLF